MADSHGAIRPETIRHVDPSPGKRFTLYKPWRCSCYMQFLGEEDNSIPCKEKYVPMCTMQCTYHFNSSHRNSTKSIDRQTATFSRLDKLVSSWPTYFCRGFAPRSWGKSSIANGPLGEMSSVGQNVYGANCPQSEKSIHRRFAAKLSTIYFTSHQLQCYATLRKKTHVQNYH